MTDLFLTYLLASVSFILSLIIAAALFRAEKLNENESSEFNKIFTCFCCLTLTAYFLSDPFFSSGGYGVFEGEFSSLSDIKQLTLVIIFIGSFIGVFFALIFGPLLLCDFKQWLELRFNSKKKNAEEVIHNRS